ncbi:roadblock/LC7 domain-containing protein [Streptomyces syringium]|uniref:Regulator of Ras-like GTPase activity (Roadblock/LC7/MglB family) n=1 Tax=Streptomyces syringium TaxID=76729 RepID=A0ABS4XW53_9ACTN|nr:roadblock/LC7 domain-containing protein [Streptomyces syringium]MBP2400748.1 putative regulator of Ras-like GTPase activity (Roadblock/LC7/MglB family) [Streptomyces syringium]
MGGHDNRTCAVRVSGHGRGRHLEIRLPGADANPYLALASVLAAAHHGIREALTPPPASTGNAYTTTAHTPVPAGLDQALAAYADGGLAEHLLTRTRHRSNSTRCATRSRTPSGDAASPAPDTQGAAGKPPAAPPPPGRTCVYTHHDYDARLLDEIVADPAVRGAMVLTLDGLVRVHSTSLEVQEADRIAAGLAAAHATHRVSAEFCPPGDASWHMSLVEFSTGYVLTIAAGDDALLSASTTRDTKVDDLAHRMRALALRRAHDITTARQHLSDAR